MMRAEGALRIFAVDCALSNPSSGPSSSSSSPLAAVVVPAVIHTQSYKDLQSAHQRFEEEDGATQGRM